MCILKNEVTNYKSLELTASKHIILYFEKLISFQIYLYISSIFAPTYIIYKQLFSTMNYFNISIFQFSNKNRGNDG